MGIAVIEYTIVDFSFHCSAFGISLQCIWNFTAVYLETDYALKSCSEENGILFGPDWSFLGRGLEFGSERISIIIALVEK